MSHWQPIAIIGRSCLLPGALSPQQLWKNIISQKDCLSTLPNNHWQIDPKYIYRHADDQQPESCWTLQGGYVRDFDTVFRADQYAMEPSRITSLDPLFQWTLHTAKECLIDAGIDTLKDHHSKIDLVLGNLAYPSRLFGQYAENVWLSSADSRLKKINQSPVDPRNLFCSGLPAHLVSKALNLKGSAYALDAACASSLYALDQACRALQHKQSDIVLAGAVNCADDLFIHVGFCALNALSKSGMSRPFNKNADGLVPAEGASFVALKRLDDAIANGDTIYGVIRGIGLSNDGRSGGFLSPDKKGQLRAMEAAYRCSGIDPSSIGLLECHATGTPVGDQVEIASAKELFKQHSDLPIGSLKSNLGHLISAAGMAGLLKILGAFEHQSKPASMPVKDVHEDLASGPLRLIQSCEPWESDEPRRAALSAFGFGGNNAHVIVEEWRDDHPHPIAVTSKAKYSDANDTISVIALELAACGSTDTVSSIKQLLEGRNYAKPIENISIDLKGLKFPPNDLKHSLGQQLLILELARNIAKKMQLNEDRTGVYIGIATDPQIGRNAARWRLKQWYDDWKEQGIALNKDWLASSQAAFADPLESATVIGTMPNIPTNRINAQLNLKAASFVVCAEELSGIRALEIAERSLLNHDIDIALVGAVDLKHEPVHSQALSEIYQTALQPQADAAVLIALKRTSHAIKDGDRILSTLSATLTDTDHVLPAQKATPYPSHASSGLVQVSKVILEHYYRCSNNNNLLLAQPHLKPTTRRVNISALEDQSSQIRITSADVSDRCWRRTLSVHLYSGNTIEQLISSLHNADETIKGETRIAIVCESKAHLVKLIETAVEFLNTHPREDQKTLKEGIYWCRKTNTGKISLCFPGAATAYPGMGSDLALALPEYCDSLFKLHPSLINASEWFDTTQTDLINQPFKVLQGSTLISQFHAHITHQLLGIKENAIIGVSSGETNGMFASGIWQDLDPMFEEIEKSQMYQHWIAGNYQAYRNTLTEQPTKIDWQTWRILGPVDDIAAIVSTETGVYLSMINTDNDCIINGLASSCKRLLRKLSRYQILPLQHNIIAHCKPMKQWQSPWYALHHRKCHAVSNIDYYSNAFGKSYSADSNSIASALTKQAIDRVDFRKVVNAAWNDGVRIFIEQGPRNSTTLWIQEILGNKPHLAVALDNSKDAVKQLFTSTAQLLAAGVTLDYQRLNKRFRLDKTSASMPLNFPAHPPKLQLPKVASTASKTSQKMPTAPYLPPVLLFKRPQKNQAQYQQTKKHQPPIQQVNSETSHINHLKNFHQTVSHAHQLFLTQQERAGQLLLNRMNSKEYLSPSSISPKLPTPLHKSTTASIIEIGTKAQRKPGPKFNRDELEHLASGRLSDILGTLFTIQDNYHRQVRMPMPPLLLADRVTGIDAKPGAMENQGSIWTETDIAPDAWYLHNGHMPVGIMIESGQADLLLISWMGADFENKDNRVYRLLGCDLTFHEGGLPSSDDTLSYDIHIDGHVTHGDVRLFFFHYDCEIQGKSRLSVRGGQAGFFTDEELSHSAGIIGSAENSQACLNPRLDAPLVRDIPTSYSKQQLIDLTEGNLVSCFGDTFSRSQCHQRTPSLQPNPMLLIDEVSQINSLGGPWKRGYLEAKYHLTNNEWFYDGHFKNDPCMPGTLMFEACLQTMSFYLLAMGVSLDKDGWRFEPIPEETFELRCRGQVTPGAQTLVYEVFVEEFHNGSHPKLYADLLVTVDGLKAFHCKRMGLQLVPAYPHDNIIKSSKIDSNRPCARFNDLEINEKAILSSAWGKPTDAFGKIYSEYDGHRQIPRLPGPPYLCLSRVTKIFNESSSTGSIHGIESEFDIDPEAWYFSASNNQTMPFSILMEVALQPCGWLASSLGCALDTEDLQFRNLDGNCLVNREVTKNDRRLTCITRCIDLSKAGNICLVKFDIECYLNKNLVIKMETGFGFFPKNASANKNGLKVTERHRDLLERKSNCAVDIVDQKHTTDTAKLACNELRLIDQITGIWQEDPLTIIRAEMKVDPKQWFFKAHFYEDPVQAGSLGIEAMLQVIKYHLLRKTSSDSKGKLKFQSLQSNKKTQWTYRGQVTPNNNKVVILAEITDHGELSASADISYWVDNVRIYEAKNLCVALEKS